MSFGDDPLLLGNGPVRLLDLVWQIEADLIDELHRLVLIDHNLVRKWHVARVVHHLLEVVKQLVDLYRSRYHRKSMPEEIDHRTSTLEELGHFAHDLLWTLPCRFSFSLRITRCWAV